MSKLSPAPSKYPLPPTLLAEYGVIGLKGEKGWTETSPLRVIVKLLVLASRNRLAWQVSSDVLVIAVSGVAGTV